MGTDNKDLTIMKKIITFIKKETVFTIAILLGLCSMAIVPPSKDCIGYFDWKVLALLFCMMLIVAGIREQWIFRRLAEKLTANVKNSKILELILVLLPFFSSMLITNDVALITFVPFALALLNGAGLQHRIIRVVVLQTIAANLGSMLTPIGNPQNLYLYTLSGMKPGDFFLVMLPFTIISLITLVCIVLFGKKDEIKVCFEKASMPIHKKKLALLILLFLLCMATVARVLDYRISFAVVLVTGLIFFRNLFRDVDYYLLGTFCGFFFFIGNMKQIAAVSDMINGMLKGHEMLTSFLLSQVISNVPATMLLSGFTKEYKQLLIGVNMGGLGTLIASLASLISYKFYAVTQGSQKGKYMLVFTAYNLLFIIVLMIACLGLYR